MTDKNSKGTNERTQLQSMALDKAVDSVFDFFGDFRHLLMSRILKPAAMVLLAIIKFFPGVFGKIINGLVSRFQSSLEKGNPLAIKTASVIRVIWLTLRRCKRFIAVNFKLFDRKTAPKRERLMLALRVGTGFIKDKLLLAGKEITNSWRRVCEVTERYKRAFMILTAVSLVFAICAVYTINAHTAYEYLYNGKTLGIVKDKDVVLSTIDLVGEKLSEAYGAHIKINTDTDITFNKIYISGERVDDAEDVLQQLTYMKDMKVTGYVLVADGNELATFDSKETAEKLLDMVQQQFMDSEGQGKDYIDIGFSEDIRIDEIDTKLAELDKPETVLDHVLTGDVQQRYHTVEKGETLSGIANRNGLNTTEIMAMNPEIVPEKLQIGQEVKLEMLVPLLTVETTEVATYNEVVPYEIVYENTTAMYKGEQTVKLAGTKGERQVTAEITRQNGVEIAKKELESLTISEATAQVVLQGSKELPPLIGQGYFKYPVRGRLTSRFGMRWGRMHNGIDLANSTGTPIYAADGGKVVSAGWSGSLGWTVVINHGGNRESLYGHCSKMLVKAGDKVYQGQHIANVGNSGNSTGPHLHFEVHINGVPKNPLNYL